jgi:hypothetical protein
MDIAPNQTLYVSNLAEKIKKQGEHRKGPARSIERRFAGPSAAAGGLAARLPLDRARQDAGQQYRGPRPPGMALPALLPPAATDAACSPSPPARRLCLQS